MFQLFIFFIFWRERKKNNSFDLHYFVRNIVKTTTFLYSTNSLFCLFLVKIRGKRVILLFNKSTKPKIFTVKNIILLTFKICLNKTLQLQDTWLWKACTQNTFGKSLKHQVHECFVCKNKFWKDLLNFSKLKILKIFIPSCCFFLSKMYFFF